MYKLKLCDFQKLKIYDKMKFMVQVVATTDVTPALLKDKILLYKADCIKF